MVDKNDNVLVANYGNVILLSGSSVDKVETLEGAAIRELQEETILKKLLAILNAYRKKYAVPVKKRTPGSGKVII